MSSEIRSDDYLGLPLIHLAGDLDSGNVGDLHHALDDGLTSSANVLLIDFSRLTYLDSAGLNVLFDALRAMSNRGWVGAIGPNPVVLKLLDMGGLTTHPCFRVFEDLESVTFEEP